MPRKKPISGPELPAGFDAFEKLYTVAEVAGYLRLNPATVTGYLQIDLMDGVKLGPREWRIPESALKRFLAPLTTN